MKVKSYRELIAWQKAVELVTDVYDLTKCFPPREVFGLRVQLERAAVSIPSNIAEGQGRRGTREFIHFLGNARGSLFEVETRVIIAEKLHYVPSARAQALLESAAEVSRILSGLIDALESGLGATASGD